MNEAPIVILVLLLGLALLTGPIGLVIALLARREANELRRRVEALERELRGREAAGEAGAQAGRDAARKPGPEAGHLAGPQAVATPAPRLTLYDTAPASLAPARADPKSPTPHRDIETILGGQWLTWLGMLAIFFGTAFFLAYDLRGTALAGTGQVLIGLVVGALFIVGGRTLAPRLGRFLARGLLGGGVGLLYLSAYAAHAFHHLVPALVVFPFLLGVAVVGLLLALGENSLMVATLTQTGALLTPYFLPAGRGEDPTPLFAYLAAVNLGSVLVARRKQWPVLPLTGLFGTALLILWWWVRAYTLDLRVVTALGVAVIWLLQAVAPLTAVRATRGWGVARALMLVANGFLFELALYELLGPGFHPLRGLATALLSLLYVVMARVFAGRVDAGASGNASKNVHPGANVNAGADVHANTSTDDAAIRMTRLTGLGLAALAIPIQFDLSAVTLGWSILALVLLYGGFRSSGLGERLLSYLVLLLAVGHALLWDSATTLQNLSSYRPWLNGNFLVGVASAGTLGFAAHLIARRRAMLTRIERNLVTPLVMVAGIVLLVRITVETIAGFQIRATLTRGDLDLAMLLTLSLIWAVYAGLLILGGFIFHYRPIRFLGIAVLALLIIKVFIFDLQELDRGYRIASFVGVGLLLLMISILYQRERKAA